MREIVVTNGEVTFNERAKTGDYSHKDVTVRLAFTIPEEFTGDIEPAIHRVAGTAVARARAMLNGADFKSVGGGAVVDHVPPADVDALGVDTGAPAAPVSPVRKRGLPAGVKASVVPQTATDPKDPAEIVEEPGPTSAPAGTAEPVGALPGPVNTAASTDPGSITDDEDVTRAADAVDVISDAVLLDAVTKKNAVLKNPPKIRELTAKYAGANETGKPPKTVRDIPADKRAAYMLELDALK